jgi:hypothetical protein
VIVVDLGSEEFEHAPGSPGRRREERRGCQFIGGPSCIVKISSRNRSRITHHVPTSYPHIH